MQVKKKNMISSIN